MESKMDLGVLEGQTKGGYFSDYIFDPSVNQCSVVVSKGIGLSNPDSAPHL